MTTEPSIALIIPTIREDQMIAFLKAWHDEILANNISVYVVEDHETPQFDLSSFHETMRLQHLCHADAPGEILDIISVKSPGCRQIGFWKAYQGDYDIMITLDDDVRPVPESTFFKDYAAILMQGLPAWVDPMQNYRSRGYPVHKTGKIASHFHIGGFMGIPDVDGETQLQYESDFQSHPPQYLNKPHFVPHQQYIPVNGGVCGWRKDMTPYIHYTIWSKELEYRRFDDIWMGVLLKTWFDMCGYRMSYGPPFVHHVRASDPHKNVVYEKEGKIWNEDFWHHLETNIRSRFDHDKATKTTPDDHFVMLCEALHDIDNAWARQESKALLKWHKIMTDL